VVPTSYERPAAEAPSDESARALGSVAGAAPAAPLAADAAKPAAQVSAIQSMAASRKLIRTGQISIEVASYQKAAQEVARLTESLGGYLADSHASRSPNGKEAGVATVRIPAERFAQSLAGFKGLGTVLSEKVSAQDVTKAYADLETRLRVKRDTAERLREILRARTAALADVLQVERELARITEEIEQMEGERRYYDQQVAFSTLTVELREPEAIVKPGSFSPIREALAHGPFRLGGGPGLRRRVPGPLAARPLGLVAFGARPSGPAEAGIRSRTRPSRQAGGAARLLVAARRRCGRRGHGALAERLRLGRFLG
jgi:hypothetical protein